jgi:glucokinase
MITVVDVGGTKTLVAQFDEAMHLINKTRFETPQNPEQFMKSLKDVLDGLSNITAISVGVPGLANDGVVTDCPHLPEWKNFALKQGLQDVYNCPVLVENDANLAGLAEINLLSPIPKTGLYLTLSTGIGSGLIINGELTPYLGKTELGHMVLFNDDKWQEWQEFASGSALTTHFGKMASELSQKDEWDWVAEKLATGLCVIIPALLPDVIVFGGGVGTHFDKFSVQLNKLLDERLASVIPHPHPKMVVAQHPEEAVLYGCYYYATHKNNS